MVYMSAALMASMTAGMMVVQRAVMWAASMGAMTDGSVADLRDQTTVA